MSNVGHKHRCVPFYDTTRGHVVKCDKNQPEEKKKTDPPSQINSTASDLSSTISSLNKTVLVLNETATDLNMTMTKLYEDVNVNETLLNMYDEEMMMTESATDFPTDEGIYVLHKFKFCFNDI